MALALIIALSNQQHQGVQAYSETVSGTDLVTPSRVSSPSMRCGSP